MTSNAAETSEPPPESIDEINTNCFESLAYGIDVSSHQGNIDWAKVKASGVEFAMIRCGYRGYETGKIVVDKYFEYNIQNAYKNGIKIGIYFYSTAITTDEAVQEALWVDLLLKEQKLKGISITYPVAYDFEEFGTHSTSRANNLSKEQYNDDAVAFLNCLSNLGYKVMHYSCKNWMLNYWDSSKLGKFDFWLAHYCKATDYTGPYVMWQYTSKGSVDGISTNVDLNISGIKVTDSGGTSSLVVCVKDGVLAYTSPNSDASVGLTLNDHTVYNCLKTYAKGWSEISPQKGVYYYVKETDIKIVEFTDCDSKYTTKDNVFYYKTCVDLEENKAGELPKETTLKSTGIFSDLWVRFEKDDETYFIKQTDIEMVIPVPDSSDESSSDTEEQTSSTDSQLPPNEQKANKSEESQTD